VGALAAVPDAGCDAGLAKCRKCCARFTASLSTCAVSVKICSAYGRA
jgi:hypothetical protein